ncbi:unnamed protein product [Camellia sinensis]
MRIEGRTKEKRVLWDTKIQTKNCEKIILRIEGRRLYTSWELIRRVSNLRFCYFGDS